MEVLSLVIVFAGLAVKLKWQGAKFFFTHKRTLLKVHYSATLVVTCGINFPSKRVDRGLISSESIKKGIKKQSQINYSDNQKNEKEITRS